VNVSYEYWEYGVSFEYQTPADTPHRFVVRHGGMMMTATGLFL